MRPSAVYLVARRSGCPSPRLSHAVVWLVAGISAFMHFFVSPCLIMFTAQPADWIHQQLWNLPPLSALRQTSDASLLPLLPTRPRKAYATTTWTETPFWFNITSVLGDQAGWTFVVVVDAKTVVLPCLSRGECITSATCSFRFAYRPLSRVNYAYTHLSHLMGSTLHLSILAVRLVQNPPIIGF